MSTEILTFLCSFSFFVFFGADSVFHVRMLYPDSYSVMFFLSILPRFMLVVHVCRTDTLLCVFFFWSDVYCDGNCQPDRMCAGRVRLRKPCRIPPTLCVCYFFVFSTRVAVCDGCSNTELVSVLRCPDFEYGN